MGKNSSKFSRILNFWLLIFLMCTLLAFRIIRDSFSTQQTKGAIEISFAQELYANDSRIQRDTRRLQLLNDSLPRPDTLEERLRKLLKCVDRPLRLEKLQHGEYWLLRNYVRGTISTSAGCADTITLTTNGDYTFFASLPFLVERWLAPISFAIFAPGYDFNTTMDCIQYVRNCLVESKYIREYVTFHIYFPSSHMPTYVPLSEEDAVMWPFECEAWPPYENVNVRVMYKNVNHLTYPINVGRNIARQAANTHFIFASDIELFPTPGLPKLFLELIDRNRSIYLDAKSKRVFPLPIFEVTKNSKVPKNKMRLIQMLRKGKAIPFHRELCVLCHLVPKQNQWLTAPDVQELTVFSTTKRENKFAYWEPFYISDNKEPIFDERVTWEGQSNKRIQGYAMCLLEYDYYVLHPAFLVHTPGIKRFNRYEYWKRLRFIQPMNKLIENVIQPEYQILYGSNGKCKT